MNFRALFLPILLAGIAAATPAAAQSDPSAGVDSANSAGAPLWRGMPVLPPGSPDEKTCRKHGCIYIVNLSGHIVSDLRYAVSTDRKGKIKWSANQFGPSFEFYPKRAMRWIKPDGMGCSLALSVIVRVGDKPIEENGSFDTCANPLMLFYIYDPLDEKRGTVTVDPNPGDPASPPPKP